MIEFIRKYRTITIDGIEFTIYRRSVSLLFLLLSNIEKTLKDVRYFKIVDDLLKHFYKVRITSFKSLLIRLNLKRLTFKQKVELINEVLKFNIGNFGSGGDKIENTSTSEKEFNNKFYYMVTQVIFYTGYTLDYVLSLDFVSLYIIFQNTRFFRFNNSMDFAGAYDLQKYKKVLQL